MITAQRIKQAREESGHSKMSLAREIDQNRSTIHRWETGESKPRLENIAELAKATGKPVEFFFREED